MKFKNKVKKHQDCINMHKKIQIKNKSENMDYKYRNNQKKTNTINSTNFIIKNINNLGYSFYNKKGPGKKFVARKKEKRKTKHEYRGYEYKSKKSTNGLFPYIVNSKMKNKCTYVYK